MRQNIIPADIGATPAEGVSALTRLAKSLLLGQLGKIRDGRLRLIDGDLDRSFGHATASGPFDVTLRVHHPRFYSDVAFAGTVGAGEAFINGLWECDDLTGLEAERAVPEDGPLAEPQRQEREPAQHRGPLRSRQ